MEAKAAAEAKQKSIQEAKERLAEKFKDVRTGGAGSQRRKFKAAPKSGASDSKLEAVMKKFNTQEIPEITEVNFFTKDNKVINFQKPKGIICLRQSTLPSRLKP